MTEKFKYEGRDLMEVFLEEDLEAVNRAEEQLRFSMTVEEKNVALLDSIAQVILENINVDFDRCKNIYLKYIDYLASFDKKSAREAEYSLYFKTDEKTHAAYGALIAVEKENLTSPDGLLYYLASVGDFWSDKTVGILMSTFGNTESADSIIEKLKAGDKEAMEMDYSDNRILKYGEMLGMYIGESSVEISDEDWNEIAEALNLLISTKDKDIETRVAEITKSILATRVRMNILNFYMGDIVGLKDEDAQKEYDLLLSTFEIPTNPNDEDEDDKVIFC